MEKGNREEIESKSQEKIEYRKTKHPLEYPNIGSIFKNVPVQSLSKNQKQELLQFLKNREDDAARQEGPGAAR